MTYLLAHDLGTSGNKAALFRVDGSVVASVTVAYPTAYPADGHVEQDAGDWWRAVCESTRALLEKAGTAPADIAVVAVSGTMMGCLLVDAHLEPLGNSIIWADTRASQEEAWMLARAGLQRGYRITGHRLSASYSAAKALWIRNHEPERFGTAAAMLNAKDYIVARLSGVVATDYSDASGTNLLDISALKWSDELTDAFDFPSALLPELHAAADIVGSVTPEAAAATGLLAGTPVAMGGGDGSCACVGAGVTAEGSAYNVIGTSSWISLATREPYFDDGMRTFNWVHLDPALYTPCGTMQAAGFSYGWYRDTFFGPDADATLSAHLAVSRPGAGGVLFLPYLLGERSPLWDANARGAFVGLGASTAPADLTRAVIEGVSYNLKIILDLLGQATRVDDIRVIGGGAVNAAWMQILADILGRPLAVLADADMATARGAAIAGGVGVGLYPDYGVAQAMARVETRLDPNPDRDGVYQKMFALFQQAYAGLAPVFTGLSTVPRSKAMT